jgi:hypothetical protein
MIRYKKLLLLLSKFHNYRQKNIATTKHFYEYDSGYIFVGGNVHFLKGDGSRFWTI